MPDRMLHRGLVMAVLALAAIAGASAAASVPEASVDAQFSAWSGESPGCAVGVAEQGRIVLERAYGMADLEHAVPNRPDTIFDAGSVSDRKSTRLNSSHLVISYAVFCLKKKNHIN